MSSPAGLQQIDYAQEPDLPVEELMRRREEMDFRVMERVRSRVDTIVNDPKTAEALTALDTALFFSIAFASQFSFIDPADNVSWANELVPLIGFGPDAPVWASLATADWIMKMLLALLALAPFRIIVRNILRQPAVF